MRITIRINVSWNYLNKNSFWLIFIFCFQLLYNNRKEKTKLNTYLSTYVCICYVLQFRCSFWLFETATERSFRPICQWILCAILYKYGDKLEACVLVVAIPSRSSFWSSLFHHLLVLTFRFHSNNSPFHIYVQFNIWKQNEIIINMIFVFFNIFQIDDWDKSMIWIFFHQSWRGLIIDKTIGINKIYTVWNNVKKRRRGVEQCLRRRWAFARTRRTPRMSKQNELVCGVTASNSLSSSSSATLVYTWKDCG